MHYLKLHNRLKAGILMDLSLLCWMFISSRASSGTIDTSVGGQYKIMDSDWTEQRLQPWDQGRHNHAMAYIGDDKMLLFGGHCGANLGDTWIYDLSSDSYMPMNPSTSPYYRFDHAMAYIGGDQVLLFGGRNKGTGIPNDTWLYTRSSNTWTNMNPASAPSSNCIYTKMVYLREDQVLIFGAGDRNNENETCVYDLSQNTWTRKNPTNPPPARSHYAMARIGGDKIVLFGGFRSGLRNYNDTWVYDLSENTWTNKNPSTQPMTRNGHAMAYIGGDQVVLFGGYGPCAGYAGAPLSDTWVYDLSDNTWTEDDNNQHTPRARWLHTLCESSIDGSGKVVLFGGCYNWLCNKISDDTWTFGGGDYILPTHPELPIPPIPVYPSNGAQNISLNPTLTWTPASGPTPTSYRLKVTTKSGNIIFEHDVTGTSYSVGPLSPGTTYLWKLSAKNDEGSSYYSESFSFITTFATTSKPDIIITKVTIIDGVGPEISYRITAKNNGTAATDGSKVKTRIYLSSDNDITPSDAQINDWNFTDVLAPGASKTSWNIVTTISGVPDGEYFLGVITDAKNTIQESNEDNNKGYDTDAKVTISETSESPEEPESCECNMITNWSFSDGMENWQFFAGGAGAADCSAENDTFHAQITHGGDYPHEVTLHHYGLTIVNGNTYTVTFQARAEGSRNIQAWVAMSEEPWVLYNSDFQYTLTNEWQTFTYTFTMNYPTDPLARLGFDFGTSDLDVYLDNVCLVEMVSSTDVDLNGSSMIPGEFALFQNFPNPFNPSTTIRYAVPKSCHVNLTVYNLVGKEIAVLVNETRTPGEYSIVWNGQDLASSIYLCRLKAGNHIEMRKMMLQK